MKNKYFESYFVNKQATFVGESIVNYKPLV